MFEFFDFIIDTINQVWEFFTNFLESFVLLFKYIGVIATMCWDFIINFPSWLMPFATIGITILTLYLVMGRTAGGGK